MRKKRASPYLIYKAAGSARGPARAIVVSSRTPAPRIGLCTRMDLCRRVATLPPKGTGAAAAGPIDQVKCFDAVCLFSATTTNRL